jgi:hypothetical protein
MLRDLLRGEGVAIGRARITTMMRRMGIEALYRRPNTSKPADGHKIYPYLLRGLPIDRSNQAEVAAPQPDGVFANAERLGDARTGPTRKRQQNGACSVRLSPITRPGQRHQGGALILAR